jgi:prevent-host-death family protein
MKASARDIRYHLKSIMEAVERGEEVLITKRGTVKARIVPVETQGESDTTENPFIGMWRDRKEMKDVRRYVRRIRKGRFE